MRMCERMKKTTFQCVPGQADIVNKLKKVTLRPHLNTHDLCYGDDYPTHTECSFFGKDMGVCISFYKYDNKHFLVEYAGCCTFYTPSHGI